MWRAKSEKTGNISIAATEHNTQFKRQETSQKATLHLQEVIIEPKWAECAKGSDLSRADMDDMRP